MGILDNMFKKQPGNTAFLTPQNVILNDNVSFSAVFTGLDGISSIPEAVKSINRVKNGVGQLPINVYKTTADGKVKDTESNFQKILHDRPNPWQTPIVFKSTIINQLIRTGNVYLEKLRNQNKEIVGLFPLDPLSVQVSFKGSVKTYKTKEGNKTDYEILHIIGDSINGLTGASIVDANAQIFDLAKTLETYSIKYFKNGAHATLALTSTGATSAEDYRKQVDMINQQKGELNANKMIRLFPSFELKPISTNPEQNQLIDAREYTDKQIRKVFNLPEGDKSNLEEQQIDFLINTLEPWLITLEQSFNSILPEGSFCEFNRDAILRNKALERWQIRNIQRQTSTVSINEIRESEGYEPIEGGENPFVPLSSNMKQETAPEDKDV
jgi:HK97 family phage portal protein